MAKPSSAKIQEEEETSANLNLFLLELRCAVEEYSRRDLWEQQISLIQAFIKKSMQTSAKLDPVVFLPEPYILNNEVQIEDSSFHLSLESQVGRSQSVFSEKQERTEEIKTSLESQTRQTRPSFIEDEEMTEHLVCFQCTDTTQLNVSDEFLNLTHTEIIAAEEIKTFLGRSQSGFYEEDEMTDNLTSCQLHVVDEIVDLDDHILDPEPG